MTSVPAVPAETAAVSSPPEPGAATPLPVLNLGLTLIAPAGDACGDDGCC